MTNPDPLEGRVRESLSVLLSRTPLAPDFDELPERVSARRPHPVLVVGLATVAAVAVAVAGLVLREHPDAAVDTGGTTEPPPASADTATTSPVPLVDQMETVLYMFHQPGESGRLVRLDWVMDVGSSPSDRLEALFAWRPPATSESGVHQLVNAVPERASVLSATIEPGTTLLTVDTDRLFTEEGVRAPDLIQALAQVVWTATQDPAVTDVQFRDNGVPVEALTHELRVVTRPVNRSDYPLGTEAATGAESVRVELWHCGVRPVDFAGRSWESSTEIDSTTAPLDFGGTGTMRLVAEDRAVYTDNATGEVIEFSPLVGEYQPPPCR